eukprot:216545-Amphidinium_carterae.1
MLGRCFGALATSVSEVWNLWILYIVDHTAHRLEKVEASTCRAYQLRAAVRDRLHNYPPFSYDGLVNFSTASRPSCLKDSLWHIQGAQCTKVLAMLLKRLQ